MASFLKKRNPIDGSAGPATGSANTNLGRMRLPRWMLGLRALQWLLAFLVLSLAAYALHIYRNTGVRIDASIDLSNIQLTILFTAPRKPHHRHHHRGPDHPDSSAPSNRHPLRILSS